MPGVFQDQSNLIPPQVSSRNIVASKYSHNSKVINMDSKNRPRAPNGYTLEQQHTVTPNSSPRYLLEHLATFSVGPEFGLVTPKDGLRRLLQMEKTSGIWTQKMQMKLDPNWVIILDYDDDDVVERFPMNLISDPIAYTSNDRREVYNNILIFIVRKDPKTKSPNPSEMHIFQCAQVSAQDIVDEMKMFMSGKMLPSRSKENFRHIPPPPHNPPPEPPNNGNISKIREQIAVYSASNERAPRNLPSPMHRIERSAIYNRESNDETSSTTSDRYEKEVTILNHCFDDIERFVVRLQHAAAAYKELERRQKSRKHKKKDMGDGMLSIRAKPPPEKEFVDVLQKFKLSFNLLAKLKSHIHDPNAPELVHFLFTPLALIVDAAHDANHGANIAARVVSPLLTRDSVELLANCCTSKETDLWHSLGDAWIIPREQWKGYQSSYHPVFSNGWAPENVDDVSTLSHKLHGEELELQHQDYSRGFAHPERNSRYGSECYGSDHIEHDQIQSHMTNSRISPSYNHHYDSRPVNHRHGDIDGGSVLSPESNFHDNQDRDVRSEFSNDSIEHGDGSINPQRHFDQQQMNWLDELKRRRAKIVQVVYPRTANNEKELTVVRGEILEVIDDSRKWWKARNMQGQIAHVPHTIVLPYLPNEEDLFNNPVYAVRSRDDTYSQSDLSSIKNNFIDDGSNTHQGHGRPQDIQMPSTQPTPADWVRRERQVADMKKNMNLKLDAVVQTDESITPLPSPPSFSPKSTENSPSDWFPPPPSEDVLQSSEPLQSHNITIIQIRKGDKMTSEKEPEESNLSNISTSPGGSRQQNADDKHEETKPESLRERFAQRNKINDSSNRKTANHHQTPTMNSEVKSWSSHQKGPTPVYYQEERKKVWKKIQCPEHMTADCFYITESSLSKDVAHWLHIKGFSPQACDALKQLTGEALFALKKEQLESHLGDEGLHVYNNILHQKNACNHRAYTAKDLKRILAERRQKIEQNSEV